MQFDRCASEGYSVFRYSINARRFSSVLIRSHMSWPPFPHPSRAVLNQLRSLPNRRSSCKSSLAPSSGSRNSTCPTRSRSKCLRGHHAEDRRPLRNRAEQMVQRRDAAVVQVRVVRPDAGQRRRRITFALLQRPFRRERARVERVDESVRHDVAPRPVGADVGVDARPSHVALAVVVAMASRAAELLRVEELPAALGQRAIDRDTDTEAA